MRLVTLDLDIIEQRTADARAAWEKAKSDLAAAKAHVIATHENPGKDYWLEEHHLRALYERLQTFLDMLKEATA